MPGHGILSGIDPDRRHLRFRPQGNLLKYGRFSGTESGPFGHMRHAEAFGGAGLPIKAPGDIAPVMTRTPDIPNSLLVGAHVDCRDNHELFKMLRTENLN
jgi:acetolactate synthase I/II/III large subunit